jgi:HSP20 family protein
MAEVNVVKQPKAETGGIMRPFGWSPVFEGSLFNINPFGLMRRFTEDMDRVFGSVSKEASELAEWRPAIEVKEEKGKLLLKADLPGVKNEDVKVSVMDDVLTVEGERKHEKEEKREGYYHSERSYGRFSRSIRLPEGAKVDQASAQFTNGVLEVGIPIPEAKQQRKEIPVQEPAKPKTAAG